MNTKDGNPSPQTDSQTEEIEETTVPNTGAEQEPEQNTGNPETPEQNTGDKDSSKKSKGAWISQLPKSMRSKVDPEEYPTIADFAKKFLGGEEEAEKKPEDKTTEPEAEKAEEDDWSEFELEDDGSEDVASAKNLIHELKDKGFKAKEARSIVDAIVKTNEQRNTSQFEASKKALAKNLKTLWGDDMEARKQDMQKGFARLYPTEELRKKVMQSGIVLSADFCHAMSEVGRLSRETPPPKGQPNPTKPKPADRWSK